MGQLYNISCMRDKKHPLQEKCRNGHLRSEFGQTPTGLCKECRRLGMNRWRHRKKGKIAAVEKPPEGFCKKGHNLAEVGTWGNNYCCECRREYGRAWEERLKAEGSCAQRMAYIKESHARA